MKPQSSIAARLAAIAFTAAVVAAGLGVGYVNRPGGWYEGLAKAAFNPPNWVFAPVWTILYVALGVAGWRLSRLGWRRRLFGLWVIQLMLNLTWSPLFFGLHRVGLALIVVLAMTSVTAILLARTWTIDRHAALLMIPYLAWIGFASLLNGAILILN